MHPGILSRRKKVSPYIAWKCHGKSKSNNYHDFNQYSLRHQTTVKALGSLDSGFSLLMGLNSRLIRLHWNHLLLQTNICLCLDSTAGRRVFFSQGTSLIISFTPWVRALPLGQVCCFATMSHVFLKPLKIANSHNDVHWREAFTYYLKFDQFDNSCTQEHT